MIFQQKTFWRVARTLVVIAILVSAAFFVLSNQRGIRDYFTAQNYKPDSEILKIENKIKPTNNAKTIFYASNPKVEDSEEFNKNCKNRE